MTMLAMCCAPSEPLPPGIDGQVGDDDLRFERRGNSARPDVLANGHVLDGPGETGWQGLAGAKMEPRMAIYEQDRAMRTAPGGFRDRAQRVEDDREGLAGRDQLEQPSLAGEEGLGEPQVRNCHARHSLSDDRPR